MLTTLKTFKDKVAAINKARLDIGPKNYVYICYRPVSDKECPNLVADECNACYPVSYNDHRTTEKILEDMNREVN